MMYLLGAKEIITFTPLIMVIPFIEEDVGEEVEEIEEEENGYKKDWWKDLVVIPIEEMVETMV